MAKDPEDIFEEMKRAAERFKSIAAANKGFAVEMEIKGKLYLDKEVAEDAPLTLGALIVDRIKNEIEESQLPISPETKARRERALNEQPARSRTGGAVKAARYPAGFAPNPSGHYGEDSGYLRTNFLLNIARGKKDVFAGIPKNRQKAAFVLRRISPTARGGEETRRAVHETTRRMAQDLVRKRLKFED